MWSQHVMPITNSITKPPSVWCVRVMKHDEILEARQELFDQDDESASLSGGAGCSRLVTTWFGWSENQKTHLQSLKQSPEKRNKKK